MKEMEARQVMERNERKTGGNEDEKRKKIEFTG